MNSKKVNKYGQKKVIGTPAIYLTDILKNVNQYDENVKIGDDTDLCYRLSKKGYFVGTGSGICFEMMMDNFKEFQQKAYLYGKADCEFFLKYRERRHDIGSHAIRNYLIKMIYFAIIDFKFQYLPLIFIYSFSRFSGLYFNLIKKSN
jgi:GT2 family glycosyltransferase